MVKDVSAPYTIPQWDEYQRGLEALGNVLSPFNNRNEHSKKGMTYNDLMVKVNSNLGAFYLYSVYANIYIYIANSASLQVSAPVCRAP